MGYNCFDRQTARRVLNSWELPMSKKPTSTAISRHSLFGPPSILEGEDAAAYDELWAVSAQR